MNLGTAKISKFWKSPSYAIFIGTALIVGIGTGLGAVAFRFLIRGVEWTPALVPVVEIGGAVPSSQGWQFDVNVIGTDADAGSAP